MTTIAVLGSFNADLLMRAERRPAADETVPGEFALYLGGKGFCQAIAARRLGADVRVVGRVGSDHFGALFLAALAGEGVDTSAVTIDDQRGTGVSSLVVDPSGANSIIRDGGANSSLTEADITKIDFAGVAAALVNFATSMPAAIEFARRARDANAIVVLNPAPIGLAPDELLRLIDVIVPNASEAELLVGQKIASIDDAFAAADALRARGPQTAVVTLADIGAVAVSDDLRQHVAPFAVDCIDTVGAGDAFCGALAVRLGEGAPLAEALRFAAAAGALATTGAGAEPSMPGRAAVEALLECQPQR
jgi:ribokinase